MAGSGSDTYYWNRRLETSGSPTLDKSCQRVLVLLAEKFGVRPGFTFYDDSDGANALSDPIARFSDGPDGTIMLGVNLIKYEAQRIVERVVDGGDKEANTTDIAIEPTFRTLSVRDCVE
jgi:hypothetical protein